MDTINIILELNQELSSRELQEVEEFIEKTGYCDVLRIYETGSLDIRLSYPRYFSEVNAYLIKSAEECLEVQEDFTKYLSKNILTKYSEIRIVRADIPFTFYMEEDETFSMYYNIFKIFAEVYKKENINSDPKEIRNILKGKPETLIYADRADHKNYYQKVMIYSQYKKFKDKYTEKEFQKILKKFPNLHQRIRIEYSLRVPKNRKSGTLMTLKEFEKYNIYEMYYAKAVEYILENILNENLINEVIENKAIELENYFEYEKSKKRIDYQDFIKTYSDLIVTYEVIRKVLNNISNRKTREGAITTVRRLLRNYEKRNEIIIMDSYRKILKMIDFFCGNPQ